MKKLEFTPTRRHMLATPAPTLVVNVWPASPNLPMGQIEFERLPKGVTFDAQEFADFITTVGAAMKGKPEGGAQ